MQMSQGLAYHNYILIFFFPRGMARNHIRLLGYAILEFFVIFIYLFIF